MVFNYLHAKRELKVVNADCISHHAVRNNKKGRLGPQVESGFAVYGLEKTQMAREYEVMHKKGRNKNKWHALCSQKKAKAISAFSEINWHALCSGSAAQRREAGAVRSTAIRGNESACNCMWCAQRVPRSGA